MSVESSQSKKKKKKGEKRKGEGWRWEGAPLPLKKKTTIKSCDVCVLRLLGTAALLSVE